LTEAPHWTKANLYKTSAEYRIA